MRIADLSVPTRLLALVAAPALTLLFIGADSTLDRYHTAQETERLRQLTLLATKAGDLLHESQKERGMSAGFLGSKGAHFGGELGGQQKTTDEALRQFAATAEQIPKTEQELHATLDGLLEGFSRRAEIRAGVTALKLEVGAAVGYYTDLNAQLLQVVDGVAKASSSGEVAQAAIAYRSLMGAKEMGGIERAILVATFGGGRFTAANWERFNRLMMRQEESLDAFSRAAPDGPKAAYAEAIKDPAFAQTAQFRALAIASGGVQEIRGGDPSAWFKAQTDKLDQLRKVELLTAQAIDDEAARIGAEARAALWTTLLVLVLALLATGAVGLYVSRSIARPLSALVEAIKTVEASSDLSKRVVVTGQDEVGAAAAAFNGLLEQVEHVVGDVEAVATAMGHGRLDRYPMVSVRGSFLPIRVGLEAALDGMNDLLGKVMSAADRVEASAESVNSASLTLASGAEELSAATGTSVAATEETDAMVTSNAEHAKEVLRIGAEASAAAVGGNEKLAELQRAISGIAEASKDMGRAIKAIDEIAFLTSILAVNASVEAARAGKHGRGFAVVAKEVQNLAQRSADAANETGEMIGAAERAVGNGLDWSKQAHESFEIICGRVGEVHDLIAEMASSGDQQRIGVREITRAFQDVNASAGMIRRESGTLSSSATTLVALTKSLRADLATFRRRDSEARVEAKGSTKPERSAAPPVDDWVPPGGTHRPEQWAE